MLSVILAGKKARQIQNKNTSAIRGQKRMILVPPQGPLGQSLECLVVLLHFLLGRTVLCPRQSYEKRKVS